MSGRGPGKNGTVFVFRQFVSEVYFFYSEWRGAEYRRNHRSHTHTVSLSDLRKGSLKSATTCIPTKVKPNDIIHYMLYNTDKISCNSG